MRKRSRARTMDVSSSPSLIFLGILIASWIPNGIQYASALQMSSSKTTSTPIMSNGALAGDNTNDNMETCQCGVFLLGTEPLVFSPEAKPILSGMPVPANCSARDDKLQCASICRQLIETMSQSNEDSPLVQTVVLAATRTLACQRFNESAKVPMPRTIDASTSGGNHQAKLDGVTHQWKFLVGQTRPSLARSDVENEAEEEDEGYLGRLTPPKYLGGFYRWCDQHWIYAGVSLHEPLCCLQHLPKKCPPAKKARNGRRPRLIIRRCKNDDCSSEEEDFQSIDLITEKSTSTTTSTTTSSTTPSTTTSYRYSEEDEEDEENNNGLGLSGNSSSEVDTINPFDSTPRPVKNRKPLNSTAITEAFKFFTSLMNSMGYGDVVYGITSVLPATTAAELIDRVDVGGWVSNYQDRYMAWPREFSMGYCYLEYSLFNAANDGFTVASNNIMNRLFKNQRSSNGGGGGGGGIGGPLPSGAPMSMNGLLNPIPVPVGEPGMPGVYPPGPSNFISAMPPSMGMGDGPPGYGPGYHPHPPPPPGMVVGSGVGTRRVKRGVTVSRSYSGVAGSGSEQQPTPSFRRTFRKRLRNNNNQVPQSSTTSTTTTTTTPIPEVPIELILGNRSTPFLYPIHEEPEEEEEDGTDNNLRGSSFVPTSLDESSQQSFSNYPSSSESQPPVAPGENQNSNNPRPHYYQNQYYRYDHIPQQGQSQSNPQYGNPHPQQYQRSQQYQGYAPVNLAEYARPRRDPYNNNYHPQPMMVSRQAQPPPQSQPKQKEGPSASGLLNLANILVQTAMAGNGPSSSGGDQVTNIMTNALPLVSQVATNPTIQNMVSSLVTSFLTPPQKSKDPPPTSQPPTKVKPTPVSQILDDDEYITDDSTEEDTNVNLFQKNKNKPGSSSSSSSSKDPLRDDMEEEETDITTSSNELENNSITSNDNKKPQTVGSSPPEGGMLPNLLSSMVSTYVKYLLGGGGPPKPGNRPINNRNPISDNNKPQQSSSSSSSPSNVSNEPKDVVEMICNVAKPFFMSYFGVVPDDPGFGKLRINRNAHRHRSDKDGLSSNDILTNDPDPGTGITDVIFGSANIPETGNPVIDFGNRVVYAFHEANDAQHGLYCAKQYAVNKLWDYFRVGVRAVFKK